MSHTATPAPYETPPPRRPVRTGARAVGRATQSLLRLLVGTMLIVGFVAGGLLIGGFARFSHTVTSDVPPDDLPAADAVVVLTGGSERIATALDLMARGKGKRLLISGVNPATRTRDLASVHDAHADLIECCTDTERVSRDTIGNAVETRKWMAARGYESLVLVTSGYHMPRSRMEFDRQMPGISITPYPLTLEGLSADDWWKDMGTARLMVSEYVKYVGAWSRDYVGPDTFAAVRAGLFGEPAGASDE